MPARIPPVRPGQPVSAADHNKLVAAVNTLLEFGVAGGLQMIKGALGFKVWSRNSPSQLIEGVLDEDLLFSDVADMSIWENDADTGRTLVDVECWMLQAGKFPAGTRVTVAYVNGNPRVIGHGC
jgi:hypothetical protein